MITARARVQLTIELDSGSHWGADCSVDQILRQASRETVARVKGLLTEQCTMITEPHVIVVIAEQGKP